MESNDVMKYFDINDNAEVKQGNSPYGVVPWRVIDNDKENVYIFSVGIDESNVHVWSDLVEMEKNHQEVSPASEWTEKTRNAVIDAF